MRGEVYGGRYRVSIGNRIRHLRKDLGLSQEKLGELIGVSYQQIQKYEKGVNKINVERLLQIASALGVPVHTFFEELPGIEEQQPVYQQKGLTGEEKEIIRYLKLISDKEYRGNLLKLIKATADLLQKNSK